MYWGSPVDVANVKDLTEGTSNLGVATYELGCDASLSQVGAHGEVGDTGDHGNGSGNVVEEAVAARLGEGEANKGDGRNGHYSADSLATMSLRCIEAVEVRFLLTQYQSDP